MVVLAKLVASYTDELNYITYVFECLEERVYDSKYVMTVRYPNWDTKFIQLEDIGYVYFKEVRAGIDKWFDGQNMVPYRYDTMQFLNFVYREEKEDHKYIM